MTVDPLLDARLRTLARLTGELLDRPDVQRERARIAREARRTAVVDMSSAAIESRLRRLGTMSRLCAGLASWDDPYR